MISPRWTLCLVTLVASACEAPHVATVELEAHYSTGMSFPAFLEGVTQQAATWNGNYEGAEPDSLLLARAREVPGQWRLLVVTAPWCTDSAHTLPYVAKFAEALDNLEVRLVDREPGRKIMDAHLTPDGRPSTPTYLLLDSLGQESGCIVEMPQSLQSWWSAEGSDMTDDDAQHAEKVARYVEDAGMGMWHDLVEMLEGAAAGQPVCGFTGS